MKFLRSVVNELLHVHDIDRAITHWRFTAPTTFGIIVACVLWCLVDNVTEANLCFLVVMTAGLVAGLFWDKSTPPDRRG